MSIALHPGTYLKEAFVDEQRLTQSEIAKRTGISQAMVSMLIAGERDMTATVAVKLERAFGRSAESWMRMQVLHDLAKARTEGATR